MRRAAYLRIELADDGSGKIDAPKLREAVTIYQRLLQAQAHDPANDLALYQLARAQQLLGDDTQAIARLQELGQQYPQSALAGDASFRAAELLYVRHRYAEAEPLYRQVLAMGTDTPYYAPAQYKLGWSLYQQDRHADAAAVFVALLDADLPPGSVSDDAQQAIATVPRSKAEFAGDALRVSGLAFAAMGGGPAMNRYFAEHGEPRFAPLLYRSLGTALLDKRRYTDAAQVYTAYVDRHPDDRIDPRFQQYAIEALAAGGFDEPLLDAKRQYAQRYAPGAPYWHGQAPPQVVIAHLRDDLEDLGETQQARAQQLPVGDVQRAPAFLAAADWYRQRLALDPPDAPSADIAMHYADALFDGGQTESAAQAYEQVAYGPTNPRAAEAAYAAVQAYQRQAHEVDAARRPEVLKRSVASSLHLAQQFPAHPRRTAVLTRAAEDLYESHDDAQAIVVAQRVLDERAAPPSDAQRCELLGVVANAQFARHDYAAAEQAYTALLHALPAGAEQRDGTGENLAVAVYRQGEAARDAGKLRSAAEAFARVGTLVPDAKIRVQADYDAAAALMALKDWPSAERSLESFRARYPQHTLAADADKKLAYAYEQDRKPSFAADVYARIARRDSESAAVRSEAAWKSATFYDDAQMSRAAVSAYQYAIGGEVRTDFSHDLQARRRLADLERDTLGDEAAYRQWLASIVATDAGAGTHRTSQSQQMAAQAELEIGRLDADAARRTTLTMPLKRSLPQRKQAMQAAIDSLMRAAQSDDADITTAAAYEIGNVYRDFSRALLDSQRPQNLQGTALEQYQILLEEQADPFDQKAIDAYSANLNRVQQGIWNEWTSRSATALTALAPARYGKNEMHDDRYDALQ
nr:tetratricopeptide repeat protein [Solimonas marina]